MPQPVPGVTHVAAGQISDAVANPDFDVSAAGRSAATTSDPVARVRRPAPCSEGCPASEDVRHWVLALRDGEAAVFAAWRTIVATNPLPAVLGRICYAPCEEGCWRTRLDSPISIRTLERLVGDRALAEGWVLPDPGPRVGRRVVVVGSGPCGLSAAYHLARSGHDVVVREAHSAAGGLLRRGISEARLPKAVLDDEIARILALGVELETRRPVRKVSDAFGDAEGVIWAAGASMCMALAEGRTIWKQPVHAGPHTGPRRRTATVSVGHGMRAAEALSAHLAGAEPTASTPSSASTRPTAPLLLSAASPPTSSLVPDDLGALGDGAGIAPEASRCLSCRSLGAP